MSESGAATAIKILTILCREGIAMLESLTFLAANGRTAKAISEATRQSHPTTKTRLYVLTQKGVVQRSGGRIPIWTWTDKGAKIIEQINERAK